MSFSSESSHAHQAAAFAAVRYAGESDAFQPDCLLIVLNSSVSMRPDIN